MGPDTERRVNCLDDDCEFEIRDEEEEDLVRRIKEHAREEHGREFTDEEVRERIEHA